LFICAKDLFIEAVAAQTHGADAYQHSRPLLARLAAMPEVLPVQFMQMLCGNGVILRLDFAVADQRYGNHEQRCANDPQPEEPTSPIHCWLTNRINIPTAINRASKVPTANERARCRRSIGFDPAPFCAAPMPSQKRRLPIER